MSKRIAISGSSGLLGSALVPALTRDGHSVIVLVRDDARHESGAEVLLWNPLERTLNVKELEGVDVVINLSGAAIADSRWTDARMKLIRESRIETTRFLAESIACLERKPALFLSSSAIGIYGDRDPDELLDESGSVGEGFLADVCRDWEDAAKPAVNAGIRTIITRTGIVLTPAGGALAKLLPLFRKGLGGKMGSGRQMMSWIALNDWTAAIRHLIENDNMSGPVNLVAPNPVSNAEFSRTLGNTLGKSSSASVPAFAAKLVLGKMAVETVLACQRVIPKKLLETGFEFAFPHLRNALEHLLQSDSDDV
jgi:uncharacterized protein (TIGR01777 family)